MNPKIQKIKDIVSVLEDRLGGFAPEIGIVLGSGLGSLANSIENPVTVPYKDLPGFPVSTAVGHKGNFIAGALSGKKVLAMRGRIHFYEGTAWTW